MSGPPRNLSAEWGRLLLDGLAAAGVREVVVAPGSRSTPFVLAATADPRLRCVELVDERAAAFFALGQGRASGRPALFVCTSGTAGAHAFPAVIEASAARVPLLILTADRPLERRECGAPQTIDQTRLFGSHVRWFVELGLPDPDERALRSLQRRALQAVARATGPVAGPVHLNAPVRKPLEPPLPGSTDGLGKERCAALTARVDRLVDRAPRALPARLAAPEPAGIDALAEALAGSRRPLAVAGPAPLARFHERVAIRGALDRLGAPLYAEAASQLASLSGPPDEHPSALEGLGVCLGVEAAREALRPDLVLQLGAAPTVGGWEPAVERWCAEGGARHLVLAEQAWPDPVSTADWMAPGPLGPTLEALAGRCAAKGGAEGREPGWREALERWSEAGLRAAAERTGPGAGGRLSEPAAVRLLLEGIPEDALLGLGNSLPIRDVELYRSRRAPGGRHPVWSQRGANGIDGLVAGFAGSLSVWGETAGTERPPGVLVLGDVSLRHDLGGLAALRHLGETPLLVALVDNEGGRIFDQLPAQGLGLGERWRFWSTPDAPGWAAIAEAFGLDYREAGAPDGLREALAGWRDAEAGATLLRLVVDRDSARVSAEELRRRVAALAAGSGGGS